MKILLITFFVLIFSVNHSHAAFLNGLEVKCWAGFIDEDGNYLCQYVMGIGKNNATSEFQVTSIAAPDNGGIETMVQADRACKALKFSLAVSFVLVTPLKEEQQIRIEESLNEGTLFLSNAPYVQHVTCL